MAKYLGAKGEGLHHLAFEVEDVAAEMKRLREAGFKPLGEEPKSGADGKRIFFLHPKQTRGVLVELCQSTPVTFEGTMYVLPAGTIRLLERGPKTAPILMLLGEAGRTISDYADLILGLEQHFRLLVLDGNGLQTQHIEQTIRQLQISNVRLMAFGTQQDAALEAAQNLPNEVSNLILANPTLSKTGTALLSRLRQPLLFLCTSDHPETPHLFSAKNLLPTMEIMVLPAGKPHSSKPEPTGLLPFVTSIPGFIVWWCENK